MKFKSTKRSSWYLKWHATTVNNINYVCYTTSLGFWNLNSTTRTIWCVFLAVHNHKFTSFPWSSYFLVPPILVVTIFGILSLVILSVCSCHLNLNDVIYFTMSGPCYVSSISLFVVVVLQFLLLLWSCRVFLQSSFWILCEHSFVFSEVTVQASAPHRGMGRMKVSYIYNTVWGISTQQLRPAKYMCRACTYYYYYYYYY